VSDSSSQNQISDGRSQCFKISVFAVLIIANTMFSKFLASTIVKRNPEQESFTLTTVTLLLCLCQSGAFALFMILKSLAQYVRYGVI